MLRAVTSLVAPPLCGICADPCEPRRRVCAGCEGRLGELRATRSHLPGGLELVSAAPYEGIARDLVARMKFAARPALAEVAAERMVRAWGAARGGCLVPVPAAPARARVRGYDGALILARLIEGRTWARVAPVLERDDGPRQVGRRRRERLADPPRVRHVDPRGKLPDDVWLVDDVATTGATLLACAAALRAAGAARVRALTFARAEPFGPEPAAA